VECENSFCMGQWLLACQNESRERLGITDNL
jgi:hypothetical protein